MKSSKKHTLLMLISVISLMSITACSNMSKRDKNTAIGAGIGAVGGAILTEGSGLGTVGGGAIGGLIGHQVGKK
ncbi:MULTISPECIES: osmotically-inducible lipoprotein OsmB [unclassified Arsenophonus]|uniref:osmotically-inducible lipoprotein OsmB n=1 Tax=unclassified Arsenophonus TaxID=2627083 RepID=UPI0028669647|nr:osmotically-inducible lipoprotein OsmB [Arsenophonus sp.]MDR5610864.1 osmotically-inducible lipoprotein OsmB [Arsenophonus sp.]MDR5614683.1 osmotically-inducible lipoprotein OsmB [Arsenophonus sp.]